MPVATQLNPPVQDDWAVAQKMQVDLATLFDIINRLDIENLHTPGNTFDWNDVQLKSLVDATDGKDAVTLDQLNTAIAGAGHGTGTVTQHADVHLEGTDRYNFDNSAGGPLVKSYTVTTNQKAAMDGAAAPGAGNVFATMADVVPGIAAVAHASRTSFDDPTTSTHDTEVSFDLAANAKAIDLIDFHLHADVYGSGFFTLDLGKTGLINVSLSGNSYLWYTGDYTNVVLPINTYVLLASNVTAWGNVYLYAKITSDGKLYVKVHTDSGVVCRHVHTIDVQAISHG